ncbi:MAG: ferredoxin [Chloroflexota bacterium]|nr:ferredoxin [Chloroflexota bacterium]
MKEARLRVDWILCDGYGLCGGLAPDLIDLDEWHYPIISSEPVDRRFMDDAQRAVDCCPVRALTLDRTPPRPRPGPG